MQRPQQELALRPQLLPQPQPPLLPSPLLWLRMSLVQEGLRVPHPQGRLGPLLQSCLRPLGTHPAAPGIPAPCVSARGAADMDKMLDQPRRGPLGVGSSKDRP